MISKTQALLAGGVIGICLTAIVITLVIRMFKRSRAYRYRLPIFHKKGKSGSAVRKPSPQHHHHPPNGRGPRKNSSKLSYNKVMSMEDCNSPHTRSPIHIQEHIDITMHTPHNTAATEWANDPAHQHPRGGATISTLDSTYHDQHRPIPPMSPFTPLQAPQCPHDMDSASLIRYQNEAYQSRSRTASLTGSVTPMPTSVESDVSPRDIMNQQYFVGQRLLISPFFHHLYKVPATVIEVGNGSASDVSLDENWITVEYDRYQYSNNNGEGQRGQNKEKLHVINHSDRIHFISSSFRKGTGSHSRNRKLFINPATVSTSALCVVCKEGRQSYACLPCGHPCLCDACSDKFDGCACPVCGIRCESFVRIDF